MFNPIPVRGTTIDLKTHGGGSVPARFDASLYAPFEPGQLKLTIRLRINLRPAAPRGLPLHLDADDNAFWTKPWSGSDWMRFVAAAEAQAEMWNNRFWLIPPASCDEFDRLLQVPGGSPGAGYPVARFRPNIRCELQVDWAASSGAHRTIDVVNLDPNLLAGRAASAGTFRSHALLYDSLDGIPWVMPNYAGPGQLTTHYVIAHEIGHAIGLDHIGTILKTPLCEFAQTAERLRIDAGNFAGGTNSLVCYGLNQGLGLAGNIMGAGDAFTVENGRPWLWAMYHFRKQVSEAPLWRVVTNDPGPGTWLRDGSGTFVPLRT